MFAIMRPVRTSILIGAVVLAASPAGALLGSVAGAQAHSLQAPSPASVLKAVPAEPALQPDSAGRPAPSNPLRPWDQCFCMPASRTLAQSPNASS